MRLFIAINFDEETKKNIISVQERLKSVSRGSFSRRENLHLTLVFLGEISSSNIPAIKRVIDEMPTPKLRLNFNHLGSFQRDSGDIWWIGLENNVALLKMQKQINQKLCLAGFSLESRSYKPHLTLARQVRLLTNVDNEWLLNKPFSTEVYEISLMSSERIRGVLTYLELYRTKNK